MAPPSRCVEAEPQSTRMRAKIPAGVHADRLQPSAEKASTRNAYAECEPLDVGGGEGGAAPQHGTLVTFYSTVSVSVRSAREGLGIVVAVGPRRRGADRDLSEFIESPLALITIITPGARSPELAILSLNVSLLSATLHSVCNVHHLRRCCNANPPTTTVDGSLLQQAARQMQKKGALDPFSEDLKSDEDPMIADHRF
ncbi:hypothetical protein NA56DRAFT_699457 [Hyaloscypha hepaticicola]|uniref:Uncharacterized protein n=1 Tax=Hyaloscypha hepaticicola TaxID=2082293 RepID=A0A2J6QGY9_9HELO|nr:hypothetical protein NA56DRAFT_699457 [Hyaloscypha hepaticicola]